jgi:hypothetical protein
MCKRLPLPSVVLSDEVILNSYAFCMPLFRAVQADLLIAVLCRRMCAGAVFFATLPVRTAAIHERLLVRPLRCIYLRASVSLRTTLTSPCLLCVGERACLPVT